MFWKAAVLAAAAVGASGVLAQLTVEKYDSGHMRWPYQPGCDPLKLNISARAVLTKDQLYIISDVNRNVVYTNGTVINTPYELLVGEIALATAFSTEDFKIDWHIAPKVKYDFDFFTYSAASKRLIFAGEVRQKYGVANTSKTIFSYDPAADTVQTEEWPSKIPEERLPLTGAFINVPERQVAYYFGPIPPTVTKQFDTEVFKYNTSTGAVDRFSAPNKLWVAAAFVPVGAEGVVVLLGGTGSDGTTKLSFDSVHVYDIKGNTWYSQATGGTQPPSRQGFCTTVVSSQDRTSHQVHVYGGHRAGDINQRPSIDNHWILTIPGFIWIKAPNLAIPRTLANCNLFGKRRMLISAGSLGASEVGCLPILDVVDLSTLEAITPMNEDKAYEVPAAVVSVIGGSPTGNATISTPSAGWARGLDAVYSEHYVGTPPPEPTTPPPSDPPAPTPVGAIVGGVLGGTIAGVLLLLGILLYRRRQRAAAAAAGGANTSPETGMPVGDAYANTPTTPAGHIYEDKDGAAPPYHANYGYADATGNSGTGQNGIGQVAHELEDPESTVAELGSGAMPGKG